MAEPAQQTIREAVGVFHDRASFQSAVEDLMSAGFDRAELSLLAGARAIEEKLGHAYQKIQDLADDPTVPRAAYVGNHSLAEGRTGVIGGLAYVGAVVGAGAVVASGGTLAAAIAAAAIAGGGGGLIGGWAAQFLGRDRGKALQHQLEHGGLLLWVHVRDEAGEKRAVDILTSNGAEDVHVHDLPGSRDPANNPLTGIELDPFLPDARI
ncbi:MAG: hypothetical protein ACREJ5_23885 [Geminicoccaceae bacterium]